MEGSKDVFEARSEEYPRANGHSKRQNTLIHVHLFMHIYWDRLKPDMMLQRGSFKNICEEMVKDLQTRMQKQMMKVVCDNF